MQSDGKKFLGAFPFLDGEVEGPPKCSLTGFWWDSRFGCVPPIPSDRCNLFDGRNIELTMLEWVPGTPLSFYFNMTDGVPGLEDKSVDDGKPWNYSVEIGGRDTGDCKVIGGYPDRLYCSIQLPSSYSSTLKLLTLNVNGCEIPIYRNPIVSIPKLVITAEPPKPEDTPLPAPPPVPTITPCACG